MARVGLGLTVRQLGALAGVQFTTVNDAETGRRSTRRAKHAKIVAALEAAGAQFRPGGWVRVAEAAPVDPPKRIPEYDEGLGE